MDKAKWIWCAQQDVRGYNLTARFEKEFELKAAGEASLQITADSGYRVSINGQWVHDGPGKAYPNHYQFDSYAVGDLLSEGWNKIEVIARYYGIGTFHQIPQQAGLIAELTTPEGTIATDESWLAAPAVAWQQWTPKISIQMEPVEEYDARLEGLVDWQPAVEVTAPVQISPRKVGLLTKKSRAFTKGYSALVVASAEPCFTVPVTQLAHPGLIEANGKTTRPVVLVSTLTVAKEQAFCFDLGGGKEDFANPGATNWTVAVGGKMLKDGKVTLSAGEHPVLFFCTSFSGHEKDLAFAYLNMDGGEWGAWRVAVLHEFLLSKEDLQWVSFPDDEMGKITAAYFAKIEVLAADEAQLADHFIDVPEEQIFMDDFVAEFAARKVIGSGDCRFDGTVVTPSAEGDVELCFDLGEQSCGYYDFSIEAEEGVMIDLNSIEYIRADGVLQHVAAYNRNGLRYVTKAGVNRFTSLKRRAGQYLFVTLRNQNAPVSIQRLEIIESTAPVKSVGSFECSDSMLSRVWKISERTLHLCMEDTFTDCPLYEQTLWIGDARNEALYAFAAYGTFDVSARSLELGAQSLEHYPMVGCQVPSAWDSLIPAWSFLWGLQVWEHYFYSGDQEILRELWPAVQKNIDGALRRVDERGLFSGEFWNLIEWAPIDEDQPTVLHNNMLLVGALCAAEKCADVLGEETSELSAARKKLEQAIHSTWNDEKSSYPDSLLADGSPSPKICQHTSMLPVMCNMIPEGKTEALRQNLLNPPAEMTTVGAPFAMQFMYEALEGLGEYEALLDSIRAGYQPMVAAGSSTVWETFPGSTSSPDGFPSRSHCHAWSSSPIYFLNRIVLGIRQTKAGGEAFEISPWLSNLTSAKGATATPNGPVSIDWKIEGKTLEVDITAPDGVDITFKPNASHEGLDVKIK